MNFVTIWTFCPADRDSVIQRFGETGGPAPVGVTMLARWHDVAGGRGFAISESEDPLAMAKWCREWNDIMSFEIIPVVNDEQLVAVLSA